MGFVFRHGQNARKNRVHTFRLRPAAHLPDGRTRPPHSHRMTMIPDLTDIFARYENLRAEADTLFDRVREACPQCVTCKEGCSDCCHAMFDLSLVEAMYIHRAFEKAFNYGPERSAILERASVLVRHITRLKRELYRAEKDGESPEAIMSVAAKVKMRCPLLDDEDRCLMY